MLTTTWELHFGAPRSPILDKVLGDLEQLKEELTLERMDFCVHLDDGEKGISVMVSDIGVVSTLLELPHLRLKKLTCQFSDATYGGTAHGMLVLDDEEDENSEIYFPDDRG
jgi:hypothetical protein